MLFTARQRVRSGSSMGGGGRPPSPPAFSSTSFGSPESINFSGIATTGWFDAGSGYSFSGVLNGSTPAERWLGSGRSGSAPSLISSPDAALSDSYAHQYYADFGVNDATGG